MLIVLDYIIPIIILGLIAYMIYSEHYKAPKSDPLIDVFLIIIILAVVFVNLYILKFDFGEILSYFYIIIFLVELYNIYLIIKRYQKKKSE